MPGELVYVVIEIFADLLMGGLELIYAGMSKEEKSATKKEIQKTKKTSRQDHFFTTFAGTYVLGNKEPILFTIAQTHEQKQQAKANDTLDGRLYIGQNHHEIKGSLLQDQLVLTVNTTEQGIPNTIHLNRMDEKRYMDSGRDSELDHYRIELFRK